MDEEGFIHPWKSRESANRVEASKSPELFSRQISFLLLSLKEWKQECLCFLSQVSSQSMKMGLIVPLTYHSEHRKYDDYQDGLRDGAFSLISEPPDMPSHRRQKKKNTFTSKLPSEGVATCDRVLSVIYPTPGRLRSRRPGLS